MLLKLLFCQLPKWETKQLKTLSPQKMYPSCQSFCTIPNIIKPNMIQSLITISQETQILDRIKRSKISKIPSVANPHNVLIIQLWLCHSECWHGIPYYLQNNYHVTHMTHVTIQHHPFHNKANVLFNNSIPPAQLSISLFVIYSPTTSF